MSKVITANLVDAETRLSALVDLVESGEVDEVVIARDGRPAARLVPLAIRGRIRWREQRVQCARRRRRPGA